MSDTQTTIDNRPASVAVLFTERVAATPDGEAFRYPVPAAAGAAAPGAATAEPATGPEGAGAADGDPAPTVWASLTWAGTAERVYAIAAGLIGLGIRPEDRVALMAATRIEWILADLGVMCAGGATTTIYPSTNAGESAFILTDSGSRILIAEDATQLAKVMERRAELPELRHVVIIDPAGTDPAGAGTEAAGTDPAGAGTADTGAGTAAEPDGFVLTLAELEKRGRALLDDQPGAVEERITAITPTQLATLIYTSGTTGRPKGVRLPHDNWSYMAKAIAGTGQINKDDIQYLWLPLAHVFGKALISGQIEVGHVTAVDGRHDKIVENLPVIRPTYMAAVPRIFEKVYNGVAAKARAGGPAKYKIFRWAAEVARDYARTTQDNFRRTGSATAPFGLRSQHRIADRLVYAKLREAFGGQLRVAVSGSAALSPEIGYFFAGAGIHILEGYGLTESSAVNFVNRYGSYRTGTVGKPLPGLEVRIADDGEILLRGPAIMEGYHRQPEQTAEVLEEDGWLRTGDMGELSADGYLTITDRKKDLIKTSGGKYIAPTEVEIQLKAICPFVSNVVVIGADRNYCTALIALDEPAVLGWAAEHGLEGSTYAQVLAAPATREMIAGYVDRLNQGLQRWQTVKKFRLLPRDLDVEHGDLTPSMKLKRPAVEREFQHLVEEMYAGQREA
ncbi:AMP-dependent synthetase/ligase [Streptomyces qinzhouensis]|uniref:AMP-dependent synthetase/ligase n=1 Tax=Streptomyces qinzhouensis TaxID=2599401 RepID=UPI00164749F0|nr:long-chain fatty acid--CoA ligase [Streptomyces qinzhouensis]